MPAPSVEPGRDVRWGVLGAGQISSRALGPALTAARGATVQAVGARDADRARALADACGAPHAYGSYAEVLADATVDAVYVALSNDQHLPLTLAALAAGLPVLCEKPLCLTAAEVDAVAAASASAGLPVVEASWYRWHPRVRRAQRLLADGAVGAVRHVATGFSFPGVPEDNYRLRPERGGGALLDVGCYALSAALWAVGTPVRDVVARTSLGPTGVDLAADLVLRFDDAEAEVHVGIAEPERQWLVVTGEGGELELREQPFTSWLGHDGELWRSDGRGTEREAVPADDAYRVMVEEVSSSLQGGPGWRLPLEESRACAAVLDAAVTSARHGGAPVAPA